MLSKGLSPVRSGKARSICGLVSLISPVELRPRVKSRPRHEMGEANRPGKSSADRRWLRTEAVSFPTHDRVWQADLRLFKAAPKLLVR
jgi:hypothetical protein